MVMIEERLIFNIIDHIKVMNRVPHNNDNNDNNDNNKNNKKRSTIIPWESTPTPP